MKQFFARRWFLLALVLLLVVCFAFAEALAPWAAPTPRNAWARNLIVGGVLFLMALPLEIGALWRALRKPAPALLAVALNFGVMPPLAYLCAPLLADDLGTGLVVMAAIPCTLASVTVWTRRAGGNDAVAILVTIITNLACFLVTPAWLKLLVGGEVTLNFGELVTKLALLVVLPMVAGQLLRISRPIAQWSTAHTARLGLLAQVGILLMVGFGAVGAGVQLARNSHALAAGDWAAMLAVVAGLHLAVLILGHLLAPLFGIARPERIAVGFGGSQKTLMVGLYIGLTYFGPMTILPMVTFHVSQLLIDTVIADRLRETQHKPEARARENR